MICSRELGLFEGSQFNNPYLNKLNQQQHKTKHKTNNYVVWLTYIGSLFQKMEYLERKYFFHTLGRYEFLSMIQEN